MDQIIMLVDENDNFLGYELKEVCHSGKGKHHRAIGVMLFNNKGETLLQRRKHKRWDNVWDIAGAAHPLHINGKDESYEECGERFLRVEWGIVVPLKRLFGFNYFELYNDMCENEYCTLLVGEAPDSVKHNPDVAYDHKWVSIPELAKDIEEHSEQYTPWAIIAVKEFLKHTEGRRLLK